MLLFTNELLAAFSAILMCSSAVFAQYADGKFPPPPPPPPPLAGASPVPSAVASPAPILGGKFLPPPPPPYLPPPPPLAAASPVPLADPAPKLNKFGDIISPRKTKSKKPTGSGASKFGKLTTPATAKVAFTKSASGSAKVSTKSGKSASGKVSKKTGKSKKTGAGKVKDRAQYKLSKKRKTCHLPDFHFNGLDCVRCNGGASFDREIKRCVCNKERTRWNGRKCVKKDRHHIRKGHSYKKKKSTKSGSGKSKDAKKSTKSGSDKSKDAKKSTKPRSDKPKLVKKVVKKTVEVTEEDTVHRASYRD